MYLWMYVLFANLVHPLSIYVHIYVCIQTRIAIHDFLQSAAFGHPDESRWV